MHIETLEQWQHSHNFNIDTKEGERNTQRVILLTVVMMIIEITAGLAYGSMALLADGWHMGTHAAALGITAFAYSYARHHADDPDYSFGTGKIGVLGGFTSAVVLAIVALLMLLESSHRLLSPEVIHFNQAIAVAVLGLVVNIVSALLLQSHDHSHHHDHNIRAAYLHVLADAMTSLLAIIALLAGKAFGWIWMDPMMGIVGAIIIFRWSYGLLRDTSKILLDSSVNQQTVSDISTIIESDSDNVISDIHVWQIGSHQLAAIISIITDYPKPPEHYKKLLADFDELTHITIEINKCFDQPCL